MIKVVLITRIEYNWSWFPTRVLRWSADTKATILDCAPPPVVPTRKLVPHKMASSSTRPTKVELLFYCNSVVTIVRKQIGWTAHTALLRKSFFLNDSQRKIVYQANKTCLLRLNRSELRMCGLFVITCWWLCLSALLSHIDKKFSFPLFFSVSAFSLLLPYCFLHSPTVSISKVTDALNSPCHNMGSTSLSFEPH